MDGSTQAYPELIAVFQSNGSRVADVCPSCVSTTRQTYTDACGMVIAKVTVIMQLRAQGLFDAFRLFCECSFTSVVRTSRPAQSRNSNGISVAITRATTTAAPTTTASLSRSPHGETSSAAAGGDDGDDVTDEDDDDDDDDDDEVNGVFTFSWLLVSAAASVLATAAAVVCFAVACRRRRRKRRGPADEGTGGRDSVPVPLGPVPGFKSPAPVAKPPAPHVAKPPARVAKPPARVAKPPARVAKPPARVAKPPAPPVAEPPAPEPPAPEPATSCSVSDASFYFDMETSGVDLDASTSFAAPDWTLEPSTT